MSGGMIRVTARRASFWRAGMQFGLVPRLVAASALTPAQLVQLLDEAMLQVEISDGGEVFYAPPQEMVVGMRSLALATAHLSVDAVRTRIQSGDLVIGDDVLAAMRMGKPAVPGAGAGAEHPADHPGVPVLQPTFDPDPALPAAGGTSDAGVEVDIPAPPVVPIPEATDAKPVAAAKAAHRKPIPNKGQLPD